MNNCQCKSTEPCETNRKAEYAGMPKQDPSAPIAEVAKICKQKAEDILDRISIANGNFSGNNESPTKSNATSSGGFQKDAQIVSSLLSEISERLSDLLVKIGI